MKQTFSKEELFSAAPVTKALVTLAIPTIISQLIHLVYNMVDAFFIGRTGNAYMMAATSLTLTLVMMHIALANLFGIGGGSLVARLMGAGRSGEAGKVCAFSLYGAAAIALLYSLLIALFCDPVLTFLGASDATIGYARSYTEIVIVLGSLPSILSTATAHLLRNTGFSTQASMGLSLGGVLNMVLDPLFMFVLLPPGKEVTGAALATALSSVVSCTFLLLALRRAGRGGAPLSMRPADAWSLDAQNRKRVFAVGVPSALLTALFDVANVCVNILAAAHDDLVLAGIGIVMKVERIPNAVNLGICQGMLPIVAYNYSSGDHSRMRAAVRAARRSGLLVSALCIVLFQLFAAPVTRLFLSTRAADATAALQTVAWAAVFLRIRCLASPVQFLNYYTSYSLQAMGKGRATIVHAVVRELLIYIPLMFLLDALFGALGLASAMPAGEGLAAVFALWLLRRALRGGEARV